MKQALVLSALVISVLSGCRAVPPPSPEIGVSQSAGEDALPTLEIKSLDPSIPLGDAFPIAVKLQGAPASTEYTLRFIGTGITPDIKEALVKTDTNGTAELRLSGRATQPKLTSLDVYTDEDGPLISSSLYINNELEQDAALRTQQVEEVVGEPTTLDSYIASAPEVSGADGLDVFDGNVPPTVVWENAPVEDENGNPQEPVNLILLDSGIDQTVIPATSSGDDNVLEVQACATATARVRLQSFANSVKNFPVGTRVNIVEASGRTQTKHVGANGVVEFSFACSKWVRFDVLAFTTTGIYMHSKPFDPIGGEYMVSWSHTFNPAPGAGGATPANINNRYCFQIRQQA